MDTTIIAAVIAAAAAIIAAWVGISRQSRKKTDKKLDVFQGLGKQLFQVRYHGASIRELLGNDPGPNFARDIVAAIKAFRDANDDFQTAVGANRFLISKEVYDGAASLISASAEMINSLNLAMSGVLSTEQTVYDLNQRGKVFQERLAALEELIRKEVNRL